MIANVPGIRADWGETGNTMDHELHPDMPVEADPADRLNSGDVFAALVADGVLSENDLGHAAQIARNTGKRIASTMVLLGMASEEELAAAMARTMRCRRISSTELADHYLEIADINPHFLRFHHIVPLRLDNERLEVALADATDMESVEALRFAAAAQSTQMFVSTFAEIDEALAQRFPAGEDVDASGPREDSTEDLERLADSASDAPVIRLVQRLLITAAARKASDVHIEPMARQVMVRYRIDGRLIEAERLSTALAGPVALRIKVMAGLDIAETRLPQDGRLRFTARGAHVDVRVSTSPVTHGESIVMRLLGRSASAVRLDTLGLSDNVRTQLTEALTRPHGMILLTGPTGSGKTTTLYAALNHLKTPDVKILTVEDPVEILVEGVNQVQVQPEIDLTYANALRAFLRQDPDILMIGEIRDRETADIAMRAALTGHLVLSTLHTNSATGAFTRLADIGIEPFLTASTVIASIAQRLVRELCHHCKTEHQPTSTESDLFSQAGLSSPDLLHEPVGCPACQHSGYQGRIPIMEIVMVDEDGRDAIRLGKIEDVERRQPREETLLAHGLTLVAAGRTSLAEVQRSVILG